MQLVNELGLSCKLWLGLRKSAGVPLVTGWEGVNECLGNVLGVVFYMQHVNELGMSRKLGLGLGLRKSAGAFFVFLFFCVYNFSDLAQGIYQLAWS